MLRSVLVAVLLSGISLAARAQDLSTSALPQLALAPHSADAPNGTGFAFGDGLSVNFGNPYAEPGSIASYFGAIHVHIGSDLSHLTPLTMNLPGLGHSLKSTPKTDAPAANFKAAGYGDPNRGLNFTLTPSGFIEMGAGSSFNRH